MRCPAAALLAHPRPPTRFARLAHSQPKRYPTRRFAASESGTRVPMLFRVPPSVSTKPAAHTTALAEAVDLFPTLAEVAGRAEAAPNYCDGTSLAPVLRNAGASVKAAAYSEFVKCYSCCRVPDAEACLAGPPGQPGGTQGRCPPNTTAGLADLHEMGDCFKVPRATIDFIGYSVRSARWRYTEWVGHHVFADRALLLCCLPSGAARSRSLTNDPLSLFPPFLTLSSASTAPCCMATSTASWARSCTITKAISAPTSTPRRPM